MCVCVCVCVCVQLLAKLNVDVLPHGGVSLDVEEVHVSGIPALADGGFLQAVSNLRCHICRTFNYSLFP